MKINLKFVVFKISVLCCFAVTALIVSISYLINREFSYFHSLFFIKVNGPVPFPNVFLSMTQNVWFSLSILSLILFLIKYRTQVLFIQNFACKVSLRLGMYMNSEFILWKTGLKSNPVESWYSFTLLSGSWFYHVVLKPSLSCERLRSSNEVMTNLFCSMSQPSSTFAKLASLVIV